MVQGQIPSHFQLLYDEHRIAQEIERVGREISCHAEMVWKDSHTDLLAIPVLRGGVFFFADLVRHIEHSVEMAPAQTWGYEAARHGNELVNKPKADIQVNVAQIPAKGRSLLLVDDICDSGRTLHALKTALLDAGARSVRSAVLIKRVLEGQSTFELEWTCFEYYGSEWLVGYGMDDGDRWRNLPCIYTICQSIV